ncbi:uncharacterized protein [Halyomorpha halys]|uniref:uncharacterized protein n=1 Tax=Halyomorpha halys TaxID=286706 RepID=UPI0006D514C3
MKSFLFFLLTLCLVYGHTEVSSEKRNISEEEIKKDPECRGRLPCGWLVYNKLTRNPEFFMNNTCKCSPEKTCVKSDDMLSAGAYIFRCFENLRPIENHKIRSPMMHVTFVKEETSQSLDMTTGLSPTPFTVEKKRSDPLPSDINIRQVFLNLFQQLFSYPKFHYGKNKLQKD